MKTFHELVKRETTSCFASPDTRDLTMYDGSRWYVRLRWGYARLQRDDREDPHHVGVNMNELGSDSDGIFADHEEFERTFMHLAQQHPGMRPLLLGVEAGGADDLTALIDAATKARNMLDDIYEGHQSYDPHDLTLADAIRELDRILKEYGVQSRGW